MERKPYVIGLDLGGTNSVFGIVDGKANMVASVSVKTKGHGTAEQYVADCCEALKPIIEQVGATGMKEMGKVMGVASKQLAGKAEGAAISAKVKQLLG